MGKDTNTKELDEKNEPEPIEAEFETEMDRAKKKKREAIFEMTLFLILGILLGVTIKTEAVKKITIGFNDYQVKKTTQSYNIPELKKKLDDEMAAQQAVQQEIEKQSTQSQKVQPQEIQPQ